MFFMICAFGHLSNARLAKGSHCSVSQLNDAWIDVLGSAPDLASSYGSLSRLL